MPTSYAIISDIHGNAHALSAVMEDIDKQNVDQILCLGDIVGYGANPCECIEQVKSTCQECILGNHDHAIFHEPLAFNETAQLSIEWTRRALGQCTSVEMSVTDMLHFLEILPEQKIVDGLRLVHGSPRSPTFEYILPWDVEVRPSEKILAVFDIIDEPCFIGHSHLPGVFTDAWEFFRPEELSDSRYDLNGRKAVINVGSVGQPRDGDPRACYATVRDGVIEFHRVHYKVKQAMKAILRAGLPEKNALRLKHGK